MYVEHERPRAHIVVDDFFGPEALDAISAALPALERKMKPGLVRDIGHDGQSVFFAHRRRRNRAVWIHDPSTIVTLFREQLWSEPMIDAFDHAREPLFQIIPNCWAPHLQVSSYMTGDHYDFHEDEGAGVNLTTIVFLAGDERKVKGGDLVLSYDGEETTVRFRHNRLVIFPSKTLHRVTKVRVDSDDPKYARISLQCWLEHGRPPRRATKRAPEADRPTFLLAEASIIAAARAMIAKSSDQTPDDLYWGAFYVSRILSQNLRCLADEHDLELGPVRIRRTNELEVWGRARIGAVNARIGFVLGPKTLSLFVETGRGRAVSMSRRVVPPNASEDQTIALLGRLVGRIG